MALFSTFRSICVATDALQPGAQAVTDGEGWQTIPDSMVPIPATGAFSLPTKLARVHSDGQKFELMIVGHGSLHAGLNTIPVDVCAVASKPGDPVAATALSSWAAVPNFRSGSAGDYYAFLDEPAGHVTVERGDAALFEAAHGGRLRVVGTIVPPNSGMVMLLYMAARGAPI